MKESFFTQLIRLRQRANLSNAELAELADVPRSLVGGLQSGQRCVGEYQAIKLATALGLHGLEYDNFILLAINQCSKKILTVTKDYPAELLNRLALQLRKAGIGPEQLHDCTVVGDAVSLVLENGKQIRLETNLIAA